ncbi:hypothetical protein JOE65_000373 [Arthrobacter roseus]|nr:hypothetical protein [Arthrobacter roseus]
MLSPRMTRTTASIVLRLSADLRAQLVPARDIESVPLDHCVRIVGAESTGTCSAVTSTTYVRFT